MLEVIIGAQLEDRFANVCGLCTAVKDTLDQEPSTELTHVKFWKKGDFSINLNYNL